MLRNRVSGYPVVGDDKKLIGIITLTDLFRLIDKLAKETDTTLAQKIGECKDWPIEKIMSADVRSIKRDTPILAIVEDVIQSNIHTFPVMDGNTIVGIIGRRDILNAAFVYG